MKSRVFRIVTAVWFWLRREGVTIINFFLIFLKNAFTLCISLIFPFRIRAAIMKHLISMLFGFLLKMNVGDDATTLEDVECFFAIFPVHFLYRCVFVNVFWEWRKSYILDFFHVHIVTHEPCISRRLEQPGGCPQSGALPRSTQARLFLVGTTTSSGTSRKL
jgi:hypothetical protein